MLRCSLGLQQTLGRGEHCAQHCLSCQPIAARAHRAERCYAILSLVGRLQFGLLHGLGFAGALAEIGLPHGDIPLALFSFNVGVQLGQLTFIAVVLLLNYVARRLVQRVPDWAPRAAAYAIGCTAAYWVFQRLAASLIV